MSQQDLQERLAFLQLEQAELDRLTALAPILEEKADELVDGFYRHLLAFPETRALLRDNQVRTRLLRMQREYLVSLAGPTIDADYIARRKHIGHVHERIGLEPRWYLGAYSLYFGLLTPLVFEVHAGSPDEAERTLVTLQRLLTLDIQLAIEAYIGQRESDLEGLNHELAEAGRRLQEEFATQRRQLGQSRRRARAAEELASIGILVAGLAHEIGTPMGVIQGHAKLLEKAVDGDQARWRLDTIQEQVGRISKIIQSLLNMARPKATERIPVALEPLVETTLSFLVEKFNRRSVTVEREISEVPSVLGDPERIQQLLLNLMLNAVDAMPEGGTLRVSLQPDDSEHVVLRIADDGIGVSEGDLPHLFEPFYTTKDAGKGNGLGLTVVHGIVSDHGGQIEVESAPGEGTEFIVHLPVAESNEGET